MTRLEQYYRGRGTDLVDKSGVDEAAAYRCQDCGETSDGARLLPVIVRNLKEVDGEVVEAEGFTCHGRKCPFCRGSVKHEPGGGE